MIIMNFHLNYSLFARSRRHQISSSRAELFSLTCSALALLACVIGGCLSLSAGCLLMLATIAILTPQMVQRRRAVENLRQCLQAYVLEDKRCFDTLYQAEDALYLTGRYAHLSALLIASASVLLAFGLTGSHPVLALFFALSALAGSANLRYNEDFVEQAQLAKLSLRIRMREGLPQCDPASLPGSTALEKRYWFLKGDNRQPVATFSSMYRALRECGLPVWKAAGTSLMSALDFGPKTQKGMPEELKQQMGIGRFSPFSIYIPNLIQAQSVSNTRIYAAPCNRKGLRPGDIDMEEFRRMCQYFAHDCNYFSAADFARMHEANARRDASQGRGSWLTRMMGKMAAQRRSDQLMLLFPDMLVEENGKLVAAVSSQMMLRFYQGAAQYDLLKEHAEGNLGSEGQITLEALSGMQESRLSWLYRDSQPGEIPDGDSQGKAIILPGTWTGKLLSRIANLVWKGKVFDRQNGRLLNKILGMKLVHALVFKGESWRDGNQSIIIDYLKTSILAFFIRDEIRQVQPGLYLGRAYIRLPFGKRFSALFFALDFRH